MADTYAVPPRSALAKACQYTINRWQALRRFLEDGRLPLDNTASEREWQYQIAAGWPHRRLDEFLPPSWAAARAAAPAAP